jgi:prophage regulatory protein
MPSQKPLVDAIRYILDSQESAPEPPPPLHPDQLIRIDQLREIFPFSRPSIYRLIRAGKFPAPLSLGGGRAVGWLRREVDEYLRTRIEARDTARPEYEEVTAKRFRRRKSAAVATQLL